MTRAHRIRLDLWEAALLTFFIIMGTAVITREYFWAPSSEAAILLQQYRQKYGRQDSQNAEEWLIRDFFADRRGGVFLDVGANSYKVDSTTYALEVNLGWSGVAVEPQPQFAADYTRFRPRTRFVQAFASDHAGTATLYVPVGAPGLASSDPNYVPSPTFGRTSMQVPTLTLDTILGQAGISSLDFVSMDIENAEPEALAGFSIERFAPQLVCIEAHLAVRQAILNYFAAHGYVLVGKYWNVDLVNMYFTPAATARDSSAAGTPAPR